MLNIALITSTIAPESGVHALKRSNVKDRLEDYKKAFSFYCERMEEGIFDRIVYVDNSEYDLEEIRKISIDKGVESKIEFITYKSTIDPRNSRFYLEINLIDYFYKNSVLLKENPSCMIWKITGRYVIKNISSIIPKSCIKEKYDLYINYRNSPYKVIDFYLVGFSGSAYKIIFADNLNLYAGIKDGEIILREYLNNPNMSGLKILRRFPVIPRIIGIRGYDEGRYGGKKDLTKFYLRTLANILIPSLWI
jgi:hypothetical protein